MIFKYIQTILRRFFILLLLFLVQNKLSAQELSDVFDDGGLSKRKNIVKVNFASLFQGELPVYYERILSDKVGIEVGLGVQLPYYLPELIMLGDASLGKGKPKFAIQWRLFPKYYFKQSPEYGFVGILIRQRKYRLDEKDYTLTDYMYCYGYQWFLNDYLTFEMDAGLGYRSIKKSDVDESESALAAGYNFKLGYIF